MPYGGMGVQVERQQCMALAEMHWEIYYNELLQDILIPLKVGDKY